MITQQHTEEDLSRAYVLAVSARAGYLVHFNEGHDYGVDGSINEVTRINNRFRESGFSCDFQLKSSIKWKESEQSIDYDLDVDTYDYLCERAKNNSNPIILILLALPESHTEWLNISDDQLVMKKACYWIKLDGLLTDNTSSKRVYFPKKQIFNVENLRLLFQELTIGAYNE